MESSSAREEFLTYYHKKRLSRTIFVPLKRKGNNRAKWVAEFLPDRGVYPDGFSLPWVNLLSALDNRSMLPTEA